MVGQTISVGMCQVIHSLPIAVVFGYGILTVRCRRVEILVLELVCQHQGGTL